MKKTMIFLCLLLFAAGIQAKSDDLPSAWIHSLNGDVAVLLEGGEKEVAPKVNMALQKGDIIRTGQDSWLMIGFENGSLFRVSPETEISLDKLDYNPKKQSLLAKIGMQGLGKVYVAIQKMSKRGNQVEVNTPLAVVGVRGTSFLVDRPDKETLIMFVLQGKVIVRDLVGEQGLSTDNNTMMADFLAEVMLESGQSTVYKKGKGFTDEKVNEGFLQADMDVLQALSDESGKLRRQIEDQGVLEIQDKAVRIRMEFE